MRSERGEHRIAITPPCSTPDTGKGAVKLDAGKITHRTEAIPCAQVEPDTRRELIPEYRKRPVDGYTTGEARPERTGKGRCDSRYTSGIVSE
jgi:hypothetical protein